MKRIQGTELSNIHDIENNLRIHERVKHPVSYTIHNYQMCYDFLLLVVLLQSLVHVSSLSGHLIV